MTWMPARRSTRRPRATRARRASTRSRYTWAGYLLSQFLSPLYNRQRDDYDGLAGKRARFPLRVLRQVPDAAGRDLDVIRKIGVIEGVKGRGSLHKRTNAPRLRRTMSDCCAILSETACVNC